MAQLAIHGNWKSVAALASLLTLFGLMAYATYAHTAGPLHDLADDGARAQAMRLGLALYAFGLLTLVFGFWSKEDSVAIGGIIGLSLLVMMDILLRIGVLSFNRLRVLH